MIYTECFICHEAFAMKLPEDYKAPETFLDKSHFEYIGKHECQRCFRTNFVIINWQGSETFGIADERSKFCLGVEGEIT